MKLPAAIAAGFAAGVAFVVACHHGGTAKAGPPECAVWQFAGLQSVDIPDPVTGVKGVKELPPGWEPFGMGTAEFMRRCKP